eukprot:4972659-Alexandrium_andersonii.AAC.1
MQLFTAPLPDTSRSKTLTPPVPKSWAVDITSPFTSFNERLELQGQDCNAISTSENDRWEIRGNFLVRVLPLPSTEPLRALKGQGHSGSSSGSSA